LDQKLGGWPLSDTSTSGRLALIEPKAEGVVL
jgi:hypothetical protein